MVRQTAQSRLRVLHLAWLSLIVLAAVLAWPDASARGRLAAVLAGAALPVVALFAGRAGRLGPRLLVIGWTLFVAAAVILTGGALSPLALYALMPGLVALAMNDRALAAEAGVFGVFAYAAAGLVVRWSGPIGGETVPEMTIYAMALAGLVLAGGLVVTHMAARAPQQGDLPVEPRSPEPAAPIPALPRSGGHLWLAVTGEGRVRGFSGDRFGLDTLKPGITLDQIWPDGLAALKQPGAMRGAARLTDGQHVAWASERQASGWHLMLSQTQAAYFASLSHELKTPLGIILGYSDMMTSGLMGALPPPHNEYAAIIHETGEDLLLRVEDVLELARAEAGQRVLQDEPVDVSATAQQVMVQMTPMAARRGVTLTLDAGEEVWAQADLRALTQVWQNLVSNAIKFSNTGGSVKLKTARDGRLATFSVTDTGIGMSPEEVAHASEPFRRGSNIENREGTGLGLAIVRSLTERMGGRLEIQSEKGKGTRMHIALPEAISTDWP